MAESNPEGRVPAPIAAECRALDREALRLFAELDELTSRWHLLSWQITQSDWAKIGPDRDVDGDLLEELGYLDVGQLLDAMRDVIELAELTYVSLEDPDRARTDERVAAARARAAEEGGGR